MMIKDKLGKLTDNQLLVVSRTGTVEAYSKKRIKMLRFYSIFCNHMTDPHSLCAIFKHIIGFYFCFLVLLITATPENILLHLPYGGKPKIYRIVQVPAIDSR